MTRPVRLAGPRRRPARRHSTPESGVLRAIRAGCALLQVPCYRVNCGVILLDTGTARRRPFRGAPAGFPDLVLLTATAGVVFVECKAPGGRLSAAQVAFREQCVARDIPYVVAESWDDVAPWVATRKED